MDTPTMDLTEKDLVAKANTALDLMEIEDGNRPTQVTLLAARRIQNSNILYQLNSTQAAEWLWKPTIQKAFLLTFSSMANIGNRLY